MKWLLHLLLLSTVALATVSEPDRALFSPSRNILPNGGFENGKAGYTASGGTFVTTTSASNVAYGNMAVTWTSSAAAQKLSATQITIPAGMYGRNGVASCLIKGSGATHLIEVSDGTNVLASSPISSLPGYSRSFVNFIFPSSGTIGFDLKSVAVSEPQIYIDDCLIQPADAVNISQISQAQDYGSIQYTSSVSCHWNVSTTLPPANFPAFPGCPTPTVTGNASAPATKIPGITFASLPPGSYFVIAEGGYLSSASASNSYWRFSDGTNTTGIQLTGQAASFSNVVSGHFIYTSAQSNVTIQLQGASNDGSQLQIEAENVDFHFHVYYFPNSNQTAYTPNNTPGAWAGYHDGTCTWDSTSTSWADFPDDASCAFVETTNNNFGSVTSYGSKGPGIVFTPKTTGIYSVCAFFNGANQVGGQAEFRLIDTNNTIVGYSNYELVAANRIATPICGLYNATSLSQVSMRVQLQSTPSGNIEIGTNGITPALQWTIYPITANFPMPQIVNSVISGNPGVSKLCTFRSSGSGTILQDLDNCTASIVHNAAGDETITFATGYFSSNPLCVVTVESSTAGQTCGTFTVPSSTTVRTFCGGSGGAANNFYSVHCVGPR